MVRNALRKALVSATCALVKHGHPRQATYIQEIFNSTLRVIESSAKSSLAFSAWESHRLHVGNNLSTLLTHHESTGVGDQTLRASRAGRGWCGRSSSWGACGLGRSSGRRRGGGLSGSRRGWRLRRRGGSGSGRGCRCSRGSLRLRLGL
jgi:hypothetical protein